MEHLVLLSSLNTHPVMPLVVPFLVTLHNHSLTSVSTQPFNADCKDALQVYYIALVAEAFRHTNSINK